MGLKGTTEAPLSISLHVMASPESDCLLPVVDLSTLSTRSRADTGQESPEASEDNGLLNFAGPPSPLEVLSLSCMRRFALQVKL